MPPLPAQEVFTPGTFPTHTYVAQRNHGYEEQLKRSLLVKGFLVSILGPSKSGKTVLVDKVLGNSAVKISGSDISSTVDLWQHVLARIGERVERSQESVESRSRQLSAGAGGSAGFFG